MQASTISRIQSELKPWQLHNFGNRPSWQPLEGMIEEVGELCEAYEIIETYDFDKFVEDAKDAVADIVIYLMDFCNSMDIDLVQAYTGNTGDFQATSSPMYILQIMKNLGKVAHAHLKLKQGIRVTEDHIGNCKKYCAMVLESVQYFCLNEEFELDSLVNTTWDSVKQRDWKKFPKNGRTE
jgi:NTP pyrophosphatase (non-canonical NTP hydrolase)